MIKVEAFKCSLCGKIYESEDSCKSHQHRCYFNPKTKSCASCAFNKIELEEYKKWHQLQFVACMNNIDVSSRLQTKCKLYLAKEYASDSDIMGAVAETYDKMGQMKNTLKKCNLTY